MPKVQQAQPKLEIKRAYNLDDKLETLYRILNGESGNNNWSAWERVKERKMALFKLSERRIDGKNIRA